MELKANQLSEAQTGAEATLKQQTEEMEMLRAQHTQKLEQLKSVISSNDRETQILKRKSAERIQALRREIATFKKFKDRQYCIRSR